MKQPKIILVNFLVFDFLLSIVAGVGILERRSGIDTHGAISVVEAIVFIGLFELLRLWYTPRLAKFDVVPREHALYLPLGERI